MPDINASLKTTINGKGPQHKMHRVNEFEFTEGSDGALHAKIVDKNGNPIDSSKTEVSNLPNDYPDSAVRQELESVKAELQSLKEHTFNTRLSGSNVDQLATKGCESISISRTGTLDLGVYETVFDVVGKECELQSLAIGTDYSAISIYIEPYDVNGDTISTIGVASSNGRIYTPSPMNLDRHSGGTNDFFRNQIYDEENGNYVVTMMRGMVFPNGFRIRIRNQNTSNDRNVALSGLVSTKY